MAWKFFTALGAEKSSTGSITDRGTSLPASPYDGQEYSFVADPTTGVVWRFKYNAGSASAFKWEFVGGVPLIQVVVNSETTVSTTMGDLATVGPSITVPRAGDYYVRISARISNSAAPNYSIVGVKVGATGASDTLLSTLGTEITTMAFVAVTAAANDVLKLNYRVTGTTGTYSNRWIEVIPRRVS